MPYSRECFNFQFPDINECDPNPCLNGGTCVDSIGSYTCQCVSGFGGDDCDIGECWNII